MSIKTWSDQDQPRKKLLVMGRKSLSDAELLSILLGSGSRNESAVNLSKRILNCIGNNLNELGKMEVSELIQFKGIGEAKAVTIIAALELGIRRQHTSVLAPGQIKSSEDAYKIIAAEFSNLKKEEFWILLLNRNNRIVDKKRISTGGVSGTVVDPKVIFKYALESLASALILYHNHPSGNLKPSREDISITQKLKEAGHTLEISVLDHLIISDSGYFSFADEGIL